MNINVHVIGGGLFSFMHQFFETVLDEVENLDSINELRLIMVNRSFTYDDKIFYNECDVNNFINIYQKYCKNSFLKVNTFSRFSDIRKINSKLKINKNILERVDFYVNKFGIDNNTFGLHLRLTDMNSTHPEYGIVYAYHYIDRLRDYLSQNKNINKIFVASDNLSSIIFVKELFPELTINYIEGNRVEKETDDNSEFQLNIFKNIDIMSNIFVECLVLSKCCGLMHRISDFANYAIINSNTFQDIICLN